MRSTRRWCNSMNICSLDDLLRAARGQPEPQRLLFVFARAELTKDSTPQQRADFQAGQGGALTPLMSVDKTPEELSTFAALVYESHQFAPDWAMVFVAGLSGNDGRAPTSMEAEQSLRRMIECVKTGHLESFNPFDRQGQPVLLAGH